MAVGEMRLAGCASGFEKTVADGSKYQTEPQISGQVGFDTPYPPLLSPEFNMSKIIHLYSFNPKWMLMDTPFEWRK